MTSTSNEVSGIVGSEGPADIRMFRANTCGGAEVAFMNTASTCSALNAAIGGSIGAVSVRGVCYDVVDLSTDKVCELFKAGSDSDAVEIYGQLSCPTTNLLALANQQSDCSTIETIAGASISALSSSYVDSVSCNAQPSSTVGAICRSLRTRAPTLNAVPGTSSISLTWSQVRNASSYQIFRRTEGGTFSQITNNSSNAYTDSQISQSVVYSYYVSSRVPNGDTVFSNLASASVGNTNQGREVTLFTSDNCSGNPTATISMNTDCQNLVNVVGNISIWGVRVGTHVKIFRIRLYSVHATGIREGRLFLRLVFSNPAIVAAMI